MIELGAVLFWLVVTPKSGPPLQFEHQVASLSECMDEVERFLAHPSYALLNGGGRVQAGCVVSVLPTQDH